MCPRRASSAKTVIAPPAPTPIVAPFATVCPVWLQLMLDVAGIAVPGREGGDEAAR